MAPANRPARIVTLCVSGRPASRARQNTSRCELLAKTVSLIQSRADWHPIDALLLPAGFFKLDEWLGPWPALERQTLLDATDEVSVCRMLATRLSWRSPGCVVLAGIDTRKPSYAWRGDQLVVAVTSRGVVGSARKLFPVDRDTSDQGRRPYLLFEHDFSDPNRIVRLPNGDRALISVCYDAFLSAELLIGPTAKRAALRWMESGEGYERLSSTRVNQLVARFAQMLRRKRPTVHLVAIHGFERPGGELYWQRHGLAAASAAFGGLLTVGAAHFAEWLPQTAGQSPLASAGVGPAHLTDGCHRQAHKLAALDSFEVRLGGGSTLIGICRLHSHG